jgi:hypothetical protein
MAGALEKVIAKMNVPQRNPSLAADLQVMLPTHAPPISFTARDDPNCEGLTTVSLSQVVDLDWGTSIVDDNPPVSDIGGTASHVFPRLNSLPVIILRDSVVCAIVRYNRKHAVGVLNETPIYWAVTGSEIPRVSMGTTSVYTIWFPRVVNGTGGITPGALTETVPVSHFVHHSGEAVYGPLIPAGDSSRSGGGSRIWWMDGGADTASTLRLYVNCSRNVSAGVTTFRLIRHLDESQTEEVSVVTGPAFTMGYALPFPISFSISGYYSLAVTLSDLEMLAMRVDLEYSPATTSVFRHIPHPGIYDVKDTISSIRVAGCSALMTNPVPALFRGGTVEMYQAPPSRLWVEWLNAPDTLPALPTRRWTRMGFDNGAYMYNKPEGVEGFNPSFLREFADEVGTSYRLPRFLPLAPRSWTIAFINPPTGSAGGLDTPPKQVALLFASCLTYSSQSQWIGTSSPRLLDTPGMSATLREAPQFFENKVHLADIRGFLGHAGSFLKKWTPRIASGAMSLAGLLTGDPALAASGISGLFRS